MNALIILCLVGAAVAIPLEDTGIWTGERGSKTFPGIYPRSYYAPHFWNYGFGGGSDAYYHGLRGPYGVGNAGFFPQYAAHYPFGSRFPFYYNSIPFGVNRYSYIPSRSFAAFPAGHEYFTAPYAAHYSSVVPSAGGLFNYLGAYRNFRVPFTSHVGGAYDLGYHVPASYARAAPVGATYLTGAVETGVHGYTGPSYTTTAVHPVGVDTGRHTPVLTTPLGFNTPTGAYTKTLAPVEVLGHYTTGGTGITTPVVNKIVTGVSPITGSIIPV